MNDQLLGLLPASLRTRLKTHGEIRVILANAFWLFGDRVLRYGIGIVVIVAVARHLGPASFGSLSFATALVALLSPLITLGMDNIVVRHLVHEPAERPRVLGTAALLKAFGTLVLMGVSTAIITVLRPGESDAFLLIVVLSAATVFQSLDVIDLWFQSQVTSRYTVIARMTAFAAAAALRLTLVYLDAGLRWFAVAVLVENSLVALGLLTMYARRAGSPMHWQFRADLARRLFREGLPIALSSAAVAVYMRIDVVMLGQLRGDQDVGIYAAATRLSELWYFVATALVSSMFPSIVAAKSNGPASYLGRLRMLFRVMAVMSLAIAVVTSVFAGSLISLVFGPGYESASFVLAVQHSRPHRLPSP